MEATASVLTIAASAWALSIALTKLVQDIKRQDEDVLELEQKAETLGAVIDEVRNAYRSKDDQVATPSGGPGGESVRSLAIDATSRCETDLKRFEHELSKLLDHRRGLTGSVLRRWRMQVAGPSFARIQKSIEGHQLSLQLLMQLLHGQSLEDTRQLMAQGFAALLASNRQMFAMLQGITDPTGAPLNRQDTQATLVPPSENYEQAPTAVENDQMLHQFFEGIFAVWLKNMSADGGQSSPAALSVPQPYGSPGLLSTSPLPSPSPGQTSFEAYAFPPRDRRQSSPGIGPREGDYSGGALPMIKSNSHQSHASHESSLSGKTRSSSQSDQSMFSDASRPSPRRGRLSRDRRNTNSMNPPRVKIDLSNCEPEDRQKGLRLLDHIQKNELKQIEALIEDGATLEEEGKHEKTPLLLATYLGRVEAADILIRKGADLHATDQNDQTALHLAVRPPSAHALIPSLINPPSQSTLNPIEEHHPLINACDKDGRTPLHECAKLGKLGPAKILLDNGADINARDFAGLPPAYFAMINQRYDLTALLLSRDADFSSFQWPPLDKYGGDIEKLLRKNGKQRPGSPGSKVVDEPTEPPLEKKRSHSFRIRRRKSSVKT